MAVILRLEGFGMMNELEQLEIAIAHNSMARFDVLGIHITRDSLPSAKEGRRLYRELHPRTWRRRLRNWAWRTFYPYPLDLLATRYELNQSNLRIEYLNAVMEAAEAKRVELTRPEISTKL